MADTVRRRLPVWIIAMLGAIVALGAVAAFGSSQAQAAPELSIDKRIKPKVVEVGEQQVYIIDIKNTSGRQLTGVEMRDPLPKNVKFLRASTSLREPGSCRFVRSSRTVECGPYTLTRGQSFTVKVYVKTTERGRYKNTAFVSHTTEGFGGTRESADSARHRAVKDDKQRCGVNANNGANACVGGVQAGNGTASVGDIQAR
jgi:uncharacterized repeat protein (TIGR01451 family)